MTRTPRFLAAPAFLALLIVGSPRRSAGEDADPVEARLIASPRHHEWVTIPAPSGRKVRAFVVFPEMDKPAPAVVVIHENKGLTIFERGVADQLAEAGYVAVAPDLLSQTGPDGGDTDSFASMDAAREGIYKLPAEQVTADLDAVVAYARALPASTDAVAVAGFCWGGGQSFRHADHDPSLKAAYVFYGTAPEDMAGIKAPVHGFYGGNDFRITGQVPDVQEAMKAAGKTYDPVIYEGAGHGFFRAGELPDAKEADRKARSDAWARWKGLLKAL